MGDKSVDAGVFDAIIQRWLGLRRAAEGVNALPGAYESAASRRMAAGLLRLLDEVERARALLKRIEFEGTGRPRNGKGACPECGGIFDCQHEPGCELAALTG